MKISDIFRKRAFYGVAIFCITAIATVGALSIGGNEEDNTPDALVDLNETENPDGANQQVADNTGDNTENPEASDASQVAEIPETQEPGEVAEVPEVQDAEQVAVGEEQEQPEVQEPGEVAEQPEEPEQAEVLSPQLIAEQLNFDKSAGLLWPVSGEVVIPYSPDHGVFHYTLEQFGTSEAIVLSSTVGAEVKAAAKGVVVSIEEDVRTGTTVTLALGNNTSLVYGQLEVTDLKEGDVLEAGECIGTVAEPTRYYVVEGPNLYFQVLEGEESIDPTSLLQNE